MMKVIGRVDELKRTLFMEKDASNKILLGFLMLKCK